MKKCKLLLMIFLSGFYVVSQAAEIDAKLGWAGYQKYGFAVNGVVDKVLVNVGEKVKQGDVLAMLAANPFNYRIKKCQAKSDKFTPLIFDEKLELDHAEELFERTVLSEVELQKIDGRYRVLIENQKEVKAECLLWQWRHKLLVLKAKESAYVLSSNVTAGMVISDENKSAVFVEMVSARQAIAFVGLTYKQKSQFNVGNELKVVVDQQEFPAKVQSIAMQPDKENKYKIVVSFYYSRIIEPGKSIKIKY